MGGCGAKRYAISAPAAHQDSLAYQAWDWLPQCPPLSLSVLGRQQSDIAGMRTATLVMLLAAVLVSAKGEAPLFAAKHPDPALLGLPRLVDLAPLFPSLSFCIIC